jgi:hypothetical protein
MCKRKSYRLGQPVMAAEGPYEGQTVRLAAGDLPSGDRQVRGRCAGFPWWTLWLIWPLIGLAKWFIPLYLGAAAAVLGPLSAAGAAPFVAVALILAGLVLISRK